MLPGLLSLAALAIIAALAVFARPRIEEPKVSAVALVGALAAGLLLMFSMVTLAARSDERREARESARPVVSAREMDGICAPAGQAYRDWVLRPASVVRSTLFVCGPHRATAIEAGSFDVHRRSQEVCDRERRPYQLEDRKAGPFPGGRVFLAVRCSTFVRVVDGR